MIRETIEFGLGVALSTVDLLSKRGREFIERGKEVEDRYPRLKRITTSVGEYEERLLRFLKERLPFASKEEIAELTRKVDSILKRKK
ncbi:hypothetical protein DRP53_07640 [candidate division WOR-3 bacterium]|uniref:Uncharacterized protein n=1 Tax=candidate division WOR-3 bacterium TaxID=2052148 RepID=A0A660SG43_UNCW3|nr:MAG: hypothetical protein DRP53_07640 [candidate division WOR-3 bacterium]